MIIPQALQDLAAGVSLVILDVDGVLTDGTLAYTETGEQVKHFNAKDGFGIRMLQEENIEVAVITARTSPPLLKRMNDLKIKHLYAGFDNKLEAFERLTATLGTLPEQIAYVGDDILDLPVMREVGFPIAVGDAHFFAKENARWTTQASGGHGAVREVADGIIESKMNLPDAYDRFLAKHVGKSSLNEV